MTKRLPGPPIRDPREAYADPAHAFREDLQGLLLPRARHKTLTGLVRCAPPPKLMAFLDSVGQGRPLHLYPCR